jgi:hypothetical protein
MSAVPARTSIVGVYSLRDPKTHAIVYVGQANDMDRRYSEHCDVGSYTSNLPLRRWVKGLVDKGLLPEMRVERECKTASECDEVEERLISEAKSAGLCEFNRAPGGKTNRAVPKLANTTQEAWYDAAADFREARRLIEKARATMDANGGGAAVYGHFLASLQGFDRGRLKLAEVVLQRFPTWDLASQLFLAPGDEFGR